MGNIRWISRRCLSLAILMLTAGGCSQVFVVQGYSTGDPISRPGQVKDWPETSMHSGWEIQGWLGEECATAIDAWCDQNGNWGVTNKISNQAATHIFLTKIEFGHIDNQDFKTFVPIETVSTSFTKVESHEDKTLSETGSSDMNILVNFDRINAARPTIVIQDTIASWPIRFQNVTTCVCTPQ